jgi:conjugal transfer/type IV secretion protein DotA/TraY
MAAKSRNARGQPPLDFIWSPGYHLASVYLRKVGFREKPPHSGRKGCPTMKNSTSRLLQGFSLMVLSGLAFSAWAQPAPGDLASLTNATPAGDWSIKLWRYLFGSFADSPFSPGGPDTLMGNMFVVFNTAVFVVGFAWAMYGIVGGIVATAHEGEVLGKRLSTVWFPIRMIMGIVGMIPMFGGFTMYQAIMMMLTTVGIGIGNSLWTAGVESTSSMQALVNNSQFHPTSSSQVRSAVKAAFMSGVCIAAELEEEAKMSPPLPASQQVRINHFQQASTQGAGYTFGSTDDPKKCGSFQVQGNARQSGTLTNVHDEASWGFRAGGVNYDAIQSAATAAYVSGMATIVDQTANLGRQWYLARKAANASGAAQPPIPVETLDALADSFVKNSSAAISKYNVDGGGLQASVKSNMLSLGWFGAGAWYSTFAEANAAIADASKGPTVSASSPGTGFGSLNSETGRALNAASAAYADAMKVQNADVGDGTRALLDSAIRDHCSGSSTINGMIGTATGNCSLGQGIVSASIRASAIGSGGGGDSGGLGSFDSAGLVNPIIMMKNMGDYVMSFSATVLMIGPIMSVAKMIPGVGKFLGAADKGMDAASAMPGPAGDAAKSLGGFFAIIKTIAMVTLVLGAFMAIYIPLIPFITWMGAILAYAASVIEGLAGGSLHAMAHLDGDGDGLGQRTGHGYLFMINVIARPSLMIIGFFVASALMIVIGTLQAQLFLPAMANVQGNSVTGLFSIVAFLLVFFVMNVTLISASFNLIYVITDQVLGFVGGQINSHMGRDTEDKANNVFMLAARVGPQAIGQAAAAKAAVMKDGAGKLGDKLGGAAGGLGGAKKGSAG